MSIRKREWTTPKGELKTAWVVDYKDLQGKRRLKTFARKKEADAFAATASVEVREGVHVADSATATVDEATKLWIASIRGSGLERSTVEDYERTHRLHISPFIGSLKLTALNTIRLRAFEDELRLAERSAFTIKRTITSLGTMLADAQERGLVIRNAAREMQSRRSTSANRSEKRQKGRLKVGIDIPAREEISALLGAVSGRWRPFIITAVFTGLRASELRGLRWQDVDFDKRTVRVHQRADRYDNIGAPKSIAGERTMPVPPLLINALREWKLQCPKRKTAKLDAEGNPVMVLDLVFPNGAGNVEGLRNILRRGVHPAWMAAGITVETGEVDKDGNPILGPKYTGMHCLRHWYASWCINRKEDGGLELPPKLVQERMGHSTIAMTMDTYGHLFPRNDDGKELEQAADAIFTGAN
ncbi:site-specific integrase [Falsochrobactrum shanghaiense]|uniref:Site-specific integrase n=1 Tax=Falsochrobactrum shanghaiense TaxID=2201899 RepID=A0A316J9W2_9HYPH|nr:site-specific integrase [Falsochrobactrum shanghaiense]PWL18126.1 site-specific integrase [Falsochrobactrum shanghaiense]